MPAKLCEAGPDRGLRFLEQKLAIYVQGGPLETSRNAALDVLTGRVPDPRLQVLAAAFASQSMSSYASAAKLGFEEPAAERSARPSAMMLPSAAVRMAAVAAARQSQPVPSAWLGPKIDGGTPRVRLQRLTQRRRPTFWQRLRWALAEVLSR